MLDELLRHNSLGTKEEIQFVLFDALSSNLQRVSDIRSYCISNKYSISRSFKGIISLLEYVGFIERSGDSLRINISVYRKLDNTDKEVAYFTKPDFYKKLLIAMQSEGQIHRIFTFKNVQYKSKEKLFFIKSNLIPLQSFPLRNTLISLGFFIQDKNNSNHLIVNQSFNQIFQNVIVSQLDKRKKNKRPISLKRLKEGIERKEQVGKEAEIFVLEYEKSRLKSHPFMTKIKRISEEFSNAGYDIESFTGLNSIVPNRFIEVKSYSGQISFYWSRNEVDIAKELSEEYFLYLVDRRKYHLKDYDPIIIKDPYERIFENEQWKKETENWKIILDG